jgi:hypothetical protein
MAMLETAVQEGKLHFINEEDDHDFIAIREQLENNLDRQLHHFADVYLLIG